MVRWKDGLWYRARFIEYIGGDPEVGEAVVLLVDYGNTFKVEVQDLRRTLYCQNIPIQCIRVTLHNVIPMREMIWSTSCLDFMQEKINYSKLDSNELLRVIVKTDKFVQPLPVSIKLCPPPGLGEFEEIVWLDLAELLEMVGEAEIVKPSSKLTETMKPLRQDLDFGVQYVPAGFLMTRNCIQCLAWHFQDWTWRRWASG